MLRPVLSHSGIHQNMAKQSSKPAELLIPPHATLSALKRAAKTATLAIYGSAERKPSLARADRKPKLFS